MITDTIRINEIIGGRYDNSFVLYHHRLSKYRFPSHPLSLFLKGKPQYGAGEASIPRENYDCPRYIRITDIDENGALDNSIGVTARNIDPKYILNENDILIARSGNTVGKSYIHKKSIVKGTCFFAGYLIRFVINDSLISPDYFFIFTKLPVFNNWVKVTQRVTGQPNINAEEYSKLPIPVPPTEVQDTIVSLYSKAQRTRFDKIHQSRQLLESIDDYLFNALCIKKGTKGPLNKEPFIQKVSSMIGSRLDPNQYHQERMEMIERITRGGWHYLKEVVHCVKTLTSSLLPNETYIGMENIDSLTGYYSPSTEKETVSSAVRFKKGNILFPKLRPYLNKVHRALFDGCCSTEFYLFEAHDIHPDYLAVVLRSSMVLAQTRHLMTGNTLPRLQFSDVENLIIPVPDYSRQKEIAETVQNMRKRAQTLQEEGNALLLDAKRQIESLLIG